MITITAIKLSKTPVAAKKNSSIFTATAEEIVFLASNANVQSQNKVVLHMACGNPTFVNTLSYLHYMY